MQLLHTTFLYPRYSDMDGFAHVNNAAYLHYIEEGRVDFFHTHQGQFPSLQNGTHLLVLTSVECSFSASAVYGNPLEVHTWLLEVGGVKGKLFQQVQDRQNHTLFFSAIVEFAVVSRSGKPLKMADFFRNLPEFTPAREPLSANANSRHGSNLMHLHSLYKKSWKSAIEQRKIFHHDPAFQQTSLLTRFNELDAYRHINNAIYFTYFEEARWRLLENLQVNLQNLWDGSEAAVLAGQFVSYRKDLPAVEPVTIYTAFVEFRQASAYVVHVLENSVRELCAVALADIVSVNLKSGRPQRWPEKTRKCAPDFLMSHVET